ncbi:MAG: helix-turn-helix domain-containing protein [Chloroflexota bacterium]|nr:helix-turn-helix domain-containing protein [Chloroflexota bacterium]
MNIRDYLTIKEAAAFLGVSPNTLRNWERNGKIATYRHPINHYRLYKKDELSELLTAIEQSAAKSGGDHVRVS